jgi:hypothetical protein
VKPILLSVLTAPRSLRVHMICHLTALVLVGTGIAAANGSIVRAGALAGVVGALGFATFAVRVGWKLRQHLKPTH